MRKILTVSFIIFSFIIFGGELPLVEKATAQEKGNFRENPARLRDRQLADLIRTLTNRSTAGLVEKKTAGGGVTIDLEGRFQNVMLARIGSKGEPVAACVTGLDEANLFFRKNLETGEDLPNYLYSEESLEVTAARHGMTTDEFRFYSNLVKKSGRQSQLAPGSANIVIDINDGPGEGFNDTTPVSTDGANPGTTAGQRRLNLFNYAAGIWEAFLDSSVTITVRSQFDPLTPCSTSGGVLGSAGAVNVHRNHSNATFPNTWHHAALANKQAGSDLVSANPEINATFNSDVDNGCLGAGTRFYYGYDNSTPPGRVNLLMVLLHEMGHGLGFSSFVNGQSGALFGGFPDVYTSFMYDQTTMKSWNSMTDTERQTSALNTNGVVWTGPNVVIASDNLTAGRNGSTGHVQLFSPNPFQGGSSISHFDTAVTPNLLMEPIITPGLPTDLDLSRQQMRDIGWFRDSDGDLTPDTITNIQPNSGTLGIGSQATVTWTNNGGFTRDVIIELSTDGGATYPTVLGSGVTYNPSSPSFTFIVPNMPTTQGRIRVREDNFVAPAGFSSGNFSIQAPTAAAASVKGRVLTSGGRGIYRAVVTVTDLTGQTQTVRTNPFGYYRFNDLTVGETYNFTVSHKRYRFDPQVLNLGEDLSDFNLIALP